MAPRTFQACIAAMMTRPASASSAVGLERSPRVTIVAGSALTMPAFCSPMKAMKRPMPAATALNRGRGIAPTISRRTPETVSSRNSTPDRKTQPSAVCHGTPMPLTTV